jgi:formate-dependent nitrite reductase membrane component NrfD
MNDHYNLYIDYSPQKEWSGAPMWLEMSFGAIGGGLFLVSAFLNFNLGIVLGFLLVAAGKGIFLLVDLGKPERFLKVLARPFKSWISFGSWAFMLFGILGLIYCLPLVIGLEIGAGILGVLKAITMLLAVLLITYDGFFLAASKGIDAWNTSLLPILYGVSSLVAGTGIAMALIEGAKENTLLRINALLLITLVFLVFSYVNGLSKSTLGARKSAEILTQDLKGIFVGGLVGAGVLLPLLLVGLATLGLIPASATLVMVVAVLEVVGIFFLRFAILKAGVYAPVI